MMMTSLNVTRLYVTDTIRPPIRFGSISEEMLEKNDGICVVAETESSLCDSIAEPNDLGLISMKMKQELNQNDFIEQQKFVPQLTNIEYYLASFCDRSFSPQFSSGFPARCYLVDEVQEVINNLKKSRFVSAQTHNLNVIISVLKEFFQNIPGGLFKNMAEDFCEISLESSLHITIMYLHSIVHELPNAVHLVSYLLCKALKNICLSTRNEHLLKTYTDILMLFTPVLFPSTLGNTKYFLRAARLLLVMIDYNERIFHPLSVDITDDNHNLVSEEDCFFKSILTSLQNLEATLACDDSGVESDPEEMSSPMSIPNSPYTFSSTWSSGYNDSSTSMDVSLDVGNHLPNSFYHFTYIESDDQLSPTEESVKTPL